MNILFLCTSNIQRSKTAADYFKALDQVNSYRSAGLNERNCRRFGSTLCTEELLAWADRVFVMEQKHVDRIVLHTGDKFTSKIINLQIDDVYTYMDKELIEVLIEKTRGLW